MYSLYCAECGLTSHCELGFRGEALFPVDEGGEYENVGMEADVSETRRPSSGEAAAPHTFSQQFDHPVIMIQKQEIAMQTEVSYDRTLTLCHTCQIVYLQFLQPVAYTG